jgi:hypothetical protein
LWIKHSWGHDSVTKRKGTYFLYCINPNTDRIETDVYCKNFIEIKRSASNITSSSKSLHTLKFCCLISMDHKGSISLLISSLRVNRLLHRSGNSYPTTETSQRPTQQLHMILLRDWIKI